jgi:APA family basic amino acid/polyamine antiporter
VTFAAVSVAFAKVLGVLWPAVSSATPLFSVGKLRITSAQLVALAVIALLTATNATGLRTGTRTQNVFTTAKLAALLGLTALGLAFGGGPGTGLRSPGFWSAGFGLSSSAGPLAGLALVAALGVAMVGPLFSQSAWNNVTFAGEEIRRPERTLPLALLIGCLIVTLLYVLANIAYANVLSLPEIAHAPEDRVATAVATRLFGAGAAAATAAAIMISTFGCVNGLILSGARVCFAMARDGLFFRRLATVNSASVPANALWAQGLWAGVLVLSGSYSDLLKYVISADLVFYVMLVAAVIVLRRRRPGWERPFRTPGYPFLPVLYGVAGLALIAILLAKNPRTTWPGYALVATGLPVYFLWRRG